MKKILVTLSFAGVLSTSATGILNINQINQTNLVDHSNKNFNQTFFNNYEAIYNWADVKINHDVKTKAVGTDVSENNAFDNKATAKSWNDFFTKSKFLIVSGYFALHTYIQPEYFHDATLFLNEGKSNSLERVWEFEKTNDQWLGWGHQTSTVNLTVSARYDQKEEVTSLAIKSHIFARTAGSVHSCSTSSKVDLIRFIVD